MEYSTLERWQEVSETGVVYEIGSLYARFEQMNDLRKARGKRYRLVTLLLVIFLGKLCEVLIYTIYSTVSVILVFDQQVRDLPN